MLSDPQKRAAYDQYGHAGVDPNLGRGGAEGFGGFAEAFGDIFGDIFGNGRGRGAGGQQVYRGSDLSYAMEITLEEAAHGKETQIRIPSYETCETCKGNGAKPGTSPITCTTCHGNGTVQMRQGFFSIQQTCPQLPRQRQDHSRALPHLPRPGPDQEEQDARGQDPAGHQRRHADPLERQRRARPERRPERRSLHRDPHEAARHLRARRRRPALHGAGRHDERRARRHDRGADARRQGRDRPARRHPARQDLPPARQGHQGRALELPGRPVLPRQRRDADQAHRAPEKAPARARRCASARPAIAIRRRQRPGATASRICSKPDRRRARRGTRECAPCPPAPIRSSRSCSRSARIS